MFPPGCFRFSTRPDPIGSRTRAITMGIVNVARLATWLPIVLSWTITCPLCAKSELMQCSKKDCYSITSSAICWRCDRDVEAQRLGGLEVDDKLVLRRRLHRQVGGLFALKDAIDVTGRLPVMSIDQAHRRPGRRR